MGVWNSYTAGYQALAKADIPVKVIVVRYEDVVQNPATVLTKLSNEMGVKVAPRDLTVIETNARSFDKKSKNREAALATLRTKSYRKAFTAAELRKMCAELDHKMLVDFDYQNECQ